MQFKREVIVSKIEKFCQQTGTCYDLIASAVFESRYSESIDSVLLSLDCKVHASNSFIIRCLKDARETSQVKEVKTSSDLSEVTQALQSLRDELQKVQLEANKARSSELREIAKQMEAKLRTYCFLILFSVLALTGILLLSNMITIETSFGSFGGRYLTS